MLKKPVYNETLTHIICECSVAEDDMKYSIIEESATIDDMGNKVPVVTILTTLQSFNVENWNKRIYGGDDVMKAIDNDGMIQNDIKHGQWIGEFGHPLDLDVRRQMTLDPKTASHRMMKYWRDGNLLKSHVRSLPYGYGVSVARNAMDGVPSSYSLRALGGVDTRTRRALPNLKVITYDYVYRPSHIEAYEDEVIMENATYNKSDNGIYMPTSYNMGEIITESAVFQPVDGVILQEQVEDYIKDKSDNIKVIMEMFGMDNFNGTLNEAGTHMNIKQGDMILNIPVEHVINMQYCEMLNSRNFTRR